MAEEKKLRQPEFVLGERYFEGIELIYVGEKRLRHAGFPFPWEEILIEPYCGIGRDFNNLLSTMLIVGAFGYDPENGKLIKNVYGYVGVQVFVREPGFF